MRVALHACCGPCVIEPLDDLASQHEVTVVFANPNIEPEAEYARRWDALRSWADARGVSAVEVARVPGAWTDAVEGAGGQPGDRCARCYELRLRLTADEALRLGCEALSTTLSVSPYQDQDAIDRAGRAVARERGLRWLFDDYRARYPDAVRRSREADMYRQSYCGCHQSRLEAEARRDSRRARSAGE